VTVTPEKNPNADIFKPGATGPRTIVIPSLPDINITMPKIVIPSTPAINVTVPATTPRIRTRTIII